MKNRIIIFIVLFFTFIASSQTVYITKSGKKYHDAGCGSLSKSAYSINLSEAMEQGYSPCKRCNPPTSVLSSSNNQIKTFAPKSTTQKKKKTTYSSQCIALTKKGKQCKRSAESGSNYCWQHAK